MKKISVLILAVCSTVVFGQKVSDYKYISVPEKFETFKSGSFGLEAFLTKALKGKNYVVLPAGVDQWPSEAKDNSCNILNADVINDKSLFTNKVILQFKDCNKKVILESKGRSDIKEFETGYPDALQQALVKVGASNPVEMLPPTQMSTQVQDKTNATKQASNSETSTQVVSGPPASNYSNGQVDLQKIQVDAGQFILAKAGSSVPFAVFKTSSKKDVFIVKLSDGSTTLGYFENGNIVIDMPKADGRYAKEVFTGK
ncbi:hypothetical protein C1637_10605 [Chryseobacterium lactis]|uniref:Uncharacterized protein n=1 Tax=Chryseobacterium lactis TaxID=1241981 RepID=A0A3G6RQ21_CHRLC|nr:hypothetical protein [Chryseobacterium lactis]AZA82047.1 hypothetical protein EG342_09090 [Chryseobacterium lactis]AZB07045.1 hypothetical protein EG341_25205 [Chryseobacterium lactis]PNW14277.1 hypothetical protein C1637_10605 [Chryseobacterium lactis]